MAGKEPAAEMRAGGGLSTRGACYAGSKAPETNCAVGMLALTASAVLAWGIIREFFTDYATKAQEPCLSSSLSPTSDPFRMP